MKKLYEIAGADENRRFSPYCWRVRMALAHKGLEVESLPWHFTEKEAISFSEQGRVPVLIDAENTISDSWEIAKYLETEYPATLSSTKCLVTCCWCFKYHKIASQLN